MKILHLVLLACLALPACGGGGSSGSGSANPDARALSDAENALQGAVAMIAFGNVFKLIGDALLPGLAHLRPDQSTRVACSGGTAMQLVHEDTDGSGTINSGDWVTAILDGCVASGGIAPNGDPSNFNSLVLTVGEVSGEFVGEVVSYPGDFNGDISLRFDTVSATVELTELTGATVSAEDVVSFTGGMSVGTRFGEILDNDGDWLAPTLAQVLTGSATIDDGETRITALGLATTGEYRWERGEAGVVLMGELADFGLGRASFDLNGSPDAPTFLTTDTYEIDTDRSFDGRVGPTDISITGIGAAALVTVDTRDGLFEADIPWEDLSNLWFAPRIDLKRFRVISASPTEDPVTGLGPDQPLRAMFSRQYQPDTLPMSMTGRDPDDGSAPDHVVALSALPGNFVVGWAPMEPLRAGHVYTLDLSAVRSVTDEALDTNGTFGDQLTVTVAP